MPAKIPWYKQIRLTESHCWEWIGDTRKKGYGKKRTKTGRQAAHRFVYNAVVGPIPDDWDLHHECENKACVNPWHLRLMKHEDHSSLTHANRTHCKHGHEFTPENTKLIFDSTGQVIKRRCIICSRRWSLDSYYRNRRTQNAKAKGQQEQVHSRS